MKYRSKILLLSLLLLFQAACSNQAVYTEESFADDSPFKMKVDGDVAAACESVRRALLGQGYLIENADSDGIKARKAYRSDSTPNTFIEMNIVCLAENTGSTLFATGVLSTYSLKKSTSSASVGLSALGSISLPIGQSADSLVKVSEETIDDKDFYKRFFTSVSNVMSEMLAGKAPPEPLVEATAPEPAPPQQAASPTTTAETAPLATAPSTVPEAVTAQVATERAVSTTEQERIPASIAPTSPEPALSQETIPPVTRDEPGLKTAPEPTPKHPTPAPVLEPFPTRVAPATPAEPATSPQAPQMAEQAPTPTAPEAVLEPFPTEVTPISPEPALSREEPSTAILVPDTQTEIEPAPKQKTPATVLEPFPTRVAPVTSTSKPKATPAAVQEPEPTLPQEAPGIPPEESPSDPANELF